ncbi:hypothetical protein D9615_008764 [Tricholomella constricta]|uniref:ABC transporter domain-containing protein n=1 Tax=Tricholomella constricta TaxID=117010 RepID=A0A8H5H7S1_9AGAR|nr:hypothetical protein D9615_008764 [Tricholomella constricta]
MAQVPLIPRAHRRAVDDDPPRIKRVTRGIFNVVCDLPAAGPLVSFALPSKEDLRSYAVCAQSTWRLMCEAFGIAPGTFLSFTLWSLWLAVAPALSVYLCHTILDVIQKTVTSGGHLDYDVSELRLLILLWVMVEASSVIIYRLQENLALKLTGLLKVSFLPRLASANLSLDVKYLRDNQQSVIHSGWSSHENIRGLDIIQCLFTRLRDTSALFLQFYTLCCIILLSDNPNIHVLVYFLLTYSTLTLLKNAIGTQGFMFFTDNEDYRRQLSLHTMIYNKGHGQPNYRHTIAKDGVGSYIADAYARTSEALGAVPETPWYLATRPHSMALYWIEAIQSFILDHPLSLLALILPSLSASSVATMAFFLYSATRLRRSVEAVGAARNTGSIQSTMRDADRLYEVLDNVHTAGLEQGSKRYPTEESSPMGMKLSFRDVTLQYGAQSGPALKSISVDINPGQLILLVGSNGSGKSSLVNLLLRVVEPSSGSILIDNVPLGDYDVESLRESMTFLSQTDTVYPLSIRENLLMGSPYASPDLEKLEAAAKAGGCLKLLQKRGDAIVDPPIIVSQSFNQGAIGQASRDYVMLRDKERNVICLSEGQKQRVVAGRMFYRAKNTDFDLLVVDEPASSMDASAERNLYSEFLNVRKEKTTIIVAHHFQPLVKQADMILCMANGKIVQRGTHDELIHDENGAYAELYNAQSAGSAE